MTRAFVVVNPAAGGGRTGRRWPGLREGLARLGLAFEWAATTAPGDGVALARRAVGAGCPLVVAVGGDGTLNEVVNGIAGAAPTDAAVGAIVTGRGRDACHNLGLPSDPGHAARRLVEGVDARVDLGLAEWADGTRRWFVSAAGAGFDAAVARHAAARGGAGTLPYLAGVLAVLAAHRPVEAAIEIDGRAGWRGRLTAAVVANGVRYGGGMRIAPMADPCDGRLDLVVLGDIGRWELLRWLPTIYWGGHLANRHVATRRAAALRVEASHALPVHVDGETAPPTPVTLRVCPGALRLRR